MGVAKKIGPEKNAENLQKAGGGGAVKKRVGREKCRGKESVIFCGGDGGYASLRITRV